MNLVRLLYVSKLKKNKNAVKDLMDILTEAITYNSPHEIYGALYFGNGYFVQCLEGERDKLEHLFYKKIIRDPRHEQCEVIYLEPIKSRLFANWHMKYAAFNKEVMHFFKNHHLEAFNPYLLTNHTISPFINLLAKQKDGISTLRLK